MFNKSLYSLELDRLKLTLGDTNDLIKILNNNSISNLTILNCTFSEKHLILLIPYIKNTKTLISFRTIGTNLSKQIELNEFATNSGAELSAIIDEVKTSLSAWDAFLTRRNVFDGTPPPKDLYYDKYKLIISDSKQLN